MKSKTKSELMAEWASQPEQLKREREVKAIRSRPPQSWCYMEDGE